MCNFKRSFAAKTHSGTDERVIDGESILLWARIRFRIPSHMIRLFMLLEVTLASLEAHSWSLDAAS